MNEEEKNIEDLFRDSFGEYKIEPSEGLWNSINRKLLLRDFLSFSFTRFNLWYIVLGSGIIAGLIHIQPEATEINQSVPSKKDLSIQNTVSLETAKVDRFVTKPSFTEVQQVVPRELEISEVALPAEVKVPEIIEKQTNSDSLSLLAEVSADIPEKITTGDARLGVKGALEQKAAIEDILIPVAGFDFYPQSGCNNLLVQFRNESENAESYRWIFGDGGTSDEADPSYFYDKPGRYAVTLAVNSDGGSTDKITGLVEVYQKPSAVFEVSIEEETGFGRTALFYNYSQNAISYLWDFGDGNRSSHTNPTHNFFENGNFNVSLMAVSGDGCADTMVMENIFSDEEYFISFPNAFRPDMGGASDGSYNPAEPVTFIFFPLYKGVAEYQLSIYNKSGLLLFETNSISTGWSGYYNNRLVTPEVYIWKARGRFENGQPFVKAGDVTVILNHRH
jgi:PKD repeat protein